MFDLEKFINAKWDWSKRTFGPGLRTYGIIDHIKKECDEIKNTPCDLEEWVDVIFLAIDGASRAGFSGEQICAGMIAKHGKNVSRKWPDWKTMSEDEAIEHRRE